MLYINKHDCKNMLCYAVQKSDARRLRIFIKFPLLRARMQAKKVHFSSFKLSLVLDNCSEPMHMCSECVPYERYPCNQSQGGLSVKCH